MHRRHPPRARNGRRLPTAWLFTDERAGDPVAVVRRLPAGTGVVLRHYRAAERGALVERVRRAARLRRLVLVVAEAGGGGAANRADGRHVRSHAHRRHPRIGLGPGRLLTAAAHSRHELVAAVRLGADLVFLSPVFATRSHAAARPLGPLRFGLLVRGIGRPVAALGGMAPARFRRLQPLGATAWGAIDHWSRGEL